MSFARNPVPVDLTATRPYVCENCGATVHIAAGSTPKLLTTAASTNEPAHYVIRVGAANMHRCVVDNAPSAPSLPFGA